MFLRLWPSEKFLYIPIEARHFDIITSKFQAAREKSSEQTSKMVLSPKSLAGPGYIILNVIRAMNIIGLLALITSCVVLLVATHSVSRFFFFDAVSHVFVMITGMFLLASELSLFPNYFARSWPLLSPSHGFVTLALSMIVLGIDMLGNLNNDSEKRKEIGMAFWRIVVSSGIVIFILGWINLVASFVFRDRKQGITARQVRAHGAVAVHMTPMNTGSSPSAPELAQSYIRDPITPTKSSNPFRIFTTERNSTVLPSYHTTSPKSAPSPPYVSKEAEPVSPTSRYSRATTCTKKKVFGLMNRHRESLAPPLPVNPSTQDRPMEISAPMGVNPQFAHLVQRPDSALHPSRAGENQTYRWHS